jgi:enolase
MKITKVVAREIYDSRARPTVECELVLDGRFSVKASVPSGKSCSMYEAYELRDGGIRLEGAGVRKSIAIIEQAIAPLIIDKEPQPLEADLAMIELDGTSNKSSLGANTMLAVSMALYKAQAFAEDLKLFELLAFIYGAETVALPFPMFNLINGGMHADNKLAIQEFMVIPIGAPTFGESFEMAIALHHELGKIFAKYNKIILQGDEGGYAPLYTSEREALDMLMEALYRVSSLYNYKTIIALDAASSQWYNAEKQAYFLHGNYKNSDELIEWYKDLVADYPIYSLEDGLDQNDIQGWHKLAEAFENKIQIVGDDIFATNPARITKGIEQHIADTIIIKPNQIGTITETLQALTICKKAGFNAVISHRSGETEDTFIADLAVGTSASQIKAGGCLHAENLAKYSRLAAIEQDLSSSFIDPFLSCEEDAKKQKF